MPIKKRDGPVEMRYEDMPDNEFFALFNSEYSFSGFGLNMEKSLREKSPEEMKNRILKYDKALVLQSVWDIADYSDKPAIKHAKTEHNAATIRLVKRLREEGYDGAIVGSSGCALCSPCAINEGKPCRFPGLAFSCMSAYCIFVKHLADICGMIYTCEDGKLALFGMYAFE